MHIIEENYPIQKKYFTNNKDLRAYDISVPSNLALDSSVIKNLSRKEIKTVLSKLQKIFALIPDSASYQQHQVDSFYNNKRKIKYISENKLKSNNIHFY